MIVRFYSKDTNEWIASIEDKEDKLTIVQIGERVDISFPRTRPTTRVKGRVVDIQHVIVDEVYSLEMVMESDPPVAV